MVAPYFLVIFILFNVPAITSLEHMQSLNKTYTSDYCQQLELAYGDKMMSEGGEEEIELLVDGLDLTGKQVLDFGSGLGGVAHYLALHHDAEMTGVEINPDMIEQTNAQRLPHLENKISFVLLKSDNKLPFPDNSFDVVFSKGVIVHLTPEQRRITFQEFYRVLKADGTLLIHDCLSPTKDCWNPEIQALIETESLPLFAHTRESYVEELKSHGFMDIAYVDRSVEYAGYNHDIISRLQSPAIKEKFVGKFGQALYEDHVTGYRGIRDALRSGDFLSACITAKKNL